MLRLGEQYLIRAEARLKQGNLVGAKDDIDIIRERAGLAPTNANDEPSLMAAIVKERRVELFTELGQRWFDLKRTNKLIDRVTRLNPDAAQYIKPFQTVRPIPQSQIDAVTNKSEFSQNPGYQ